MSLFSSAEGAMGSSVTSASTRLVADEGEIGLDLMDIPKGLNKTRTNRVKQDRLEDSSWSGKGKGSGLTSVSQKMSPNRKGYPKGSTMSSESQNMSTTSGGTSLGHVAGDSECLDGERVAVLTSLRPGSNLDGQPPPALRFCAVTSDGGEDRGDRGWQGDREDRRGHGEPGEDRGDRGWQDREDRRGRGEPGEDQGDCGRQGDREDQRDRSEPGEVNERCPGKPKPKRISLKPALRVTLRPASRTPEEKEEGVRRVIMLDDEPHPGDAERPEEAAHPEEVADAEHTEEVERDEPQKQEGPKMKKYRRVRVKKKAPQSERDVKEMQNAGKTRNEKMAYLRRLQRERQERQAAGKPPGQLDLPESKEPQENKKPEEDKAEVTKEPQPRTPSPSSVDWKAAEEEKKRQFAEAKAAGRRILSYEEWDKERKEKNENLRQAALRRSWLDREIARRALQQERGATREAVLRSTTTSASGPLTDEEWVQMQQMMKRLPPAPEKPKKDEEQPQDKRAKTVQKDPKHGMPPPQPDLPAPPPQGYAGVWRGGCCPGFRWQGGQQGHHGPQAPQGQQGFWPGCGGQQHHGPPRGPQGFQPGLQGQQAPAQQSMSLDLGPVRCRTQEELEEATQWLNRWRGGPGCRCNR